MTICEWFALCTNGTEYAVKHPILGWVPCCGRCAVKMDVDDQKVHISTLEKEDENG